MATNCWHEFIPKQKPSRFGGKQIHEIENDNLYIVDSSGNQIGITDYDSVNQAFQGSQLCNN